MKISYVYLLTVLTIISSATEIKAQRWHFNPDSLQEVTETGTIITDTSTASVNMYYLDTDTNGTPDYMLNFGPPWYKPDSSSAQRPLNGQTVKIKGGLVPVPMMNNLRMIVVYEINDAFWRYPYDASWNNMGYYSHMGGHRMNGCNGYGFGFMHDSLKSVTLKGTVLSDTTMFYELTYIDINNDQQPDYFLNFGPHWYQPPSGISRPADGDSVVITGGLLERSPMKMVLVYTLNGQIWRDSTILRGNLAGGWMFRNMTQPVKFHSPFDTTTWMRVNPDWHSGMMGGGMMMPDSLFGQILEILPGSVPNKGNEKILAAFETGFFSDRGHNQMWRNGRCGSRMNFKSPITVQLHFTDIQLDAGQFDRNTIQVKYWDNTSGSWVTVNNVAFNTSRNTVSFTQNIAGNYFILTAEQTAVSVKHEKGITPENYSLSQNYPNPFNPATQIRYQIPEDGMVTLKVYDLLGREAAVLINENQSAGSYSVRFNADNFPSGIYIYELKANGYTESRKMLFLK